MGRWVFSLPISLMTIVIENTCVLFHYHHHQNGSMAHLPIMFKVRSWNNGMHSMSFYIRRSDPQSYRSNYHENNEEYTFTRRHSCHISRKKFEQVLRNKIFVHIRTMIKYLFVFANRNTNTCILSLYFIKFHTEYLYWNLNNLLGAFDKCVSKYFFFKHKLNGHPHTWIFSTNRIISADDYQNKYAGSTLTILTHDCA